MQSSSTLIYNYRGHSAAWRRCRWACVVRWPINARSQVSVITTTYLTTCDKRLISNTVFTLRLSYKLKKTASFLISIVSNFPYTVTFQQLYFDRRVWAREFIIAHCKARTVYIFNYLATALDSSAWDSSICQLAAENLSGRMSSAPSLNNKSVLFCAVSLYTGLPPFVWTTIRFAIFVALSLW